MEIKMEINNLKLNGAAFLKGSFEDEGISLSDLNDLMINSKFFDIPVAIKIGGCEAKTDIKNCVRAGVSSLVAPMVESGFAASKFTAAMSTILPPDSKIQKHINIETITACNSVLSILNNCAEDLTGIVVGRSDLSLSLGLTKKDVDCSKVTKKVRETLEEAKKYNLVTTMGGSVGVKSAPIIYELNQSGLLDRFETRAVIFEVANSLEEIEAQIRAAISYEISLLSERKEIHQNHADGHASRIETMKARLETK